MKKTNYIYKGVALANMLVLAVSWAANANAASVSFQPQNQPLQHQAKNTTNLRADSATSEEEQLINSAYAKFDQGDYTGAIEDFTKVLAINPKNVNALANRALAYLNSGNALDGLSDADQAAKLAPDWYFPRYIKGLCYEQLEQNESAVEEFTQSINLKQNHKWSFAHRGYNYFYLDKLDESIADFNKAILIDPAMTYAYWYRCWAHMQKGDLNMAKADADKLMALEPNSGDSHRILAIVLEKLGDKQAAIAEYKKAAELYKQTGADSLAQLALDAIARLEAQA